VPALSLYTIATFCLPSVIYLFQKVNWNLFTDRLKVFAKTIVHTHILNNSYVYE
jgi:hypothetical protein